MFLVGWFMHLDFRKAIWLAPLVWALHEAEEWNINIFESQHFADPATFHPSIILCFGSVLLRLRSWELSGRR